jgi:hypothetical protein
MKNVKSKENNIVRVPDTLAKELTTLAGKQWSYTSRGKLRSLKNKAIKKHNNFLFLQACINKGLKIQTNWENNPNMVMPVHAISSHNSYPFMGKRNLFGIKLEE